MWGPEAHHLVLHGYSSMNALEQKSTHGPGAPGAAAGADACAATAGAAATGTPSVADAFAAVPSSRSRFAAASAPFAELANTVAVMMNLPSALLVTSIVTFAASTPAACASRCLICSFWAWLGSWLTSKFIATTAGGVTSMHAVPQQGSTPAHSSHPEHAEDHVLRRNKHKWRT